MARKRIGDIIEIPLGNGINAYGRLYKEGALGIFTGNIRIMMKCHEMLGIIDL